MRSRILIAFVLASSCAGKAPERQTPSTPAPQPAPPRSSSAVPDALRCGSRLPETCGAPKRSFASLPSGGAKPSDSPTAGQMTEEAAAAKRLFDSERWAEAASALELVASGKTNDDGGNRQITEYHLAIALARSGDWNAAKDLFALIAEQPTHLKHKESFLWLSKAASGECVTARVVKAATAYDPGRLDFANERQRAVERILRFARARGLMELGKRDEAARAFALLGREPGFEHVAAECSKLLGR